MLVVELNLRVLSCADFSLNVENERRHLRRFFILAMARRGHRNASENKGRNLRLIGR